MRARHGKLVEKELINLSEQIAFGFSQHVFVENTEQFTQQIAAKNRVVLRQYVGEVGIFGLNRFHSVVNIGANIGTIRLIDQVIKLGNVGQKHGIFGFKIRPHDGSFAALRMRRQVFLNVLSDFIEAIEGMAQKNQS